MTGRFGLFAAMAAGLCLSLAAPPFDVYLLVFVGLGLFAWSLGEAPSVRSAMGRGLAFGWAFGLVGMCVPPAVVQWFTDLGAIVSYLCLVLLSGAQALGWVVGAGVTKLASSRGRVPLPLACALGVFVTLLVPSVFVWSPAGLLSPW